MADYTSPPLAQGAIEQRVAISGSSRALADLLGIDRRSKALLDGLLRDLMAAEAAAIRDATPVDTGEAKAGWALVPKANAVFLVNELPHVPWLIEGTGRRRVVGVVNAARAGMDPNARLRQAWLDAPSALERRAAGSFLLD